MAVYQANDRLHHADTFDESGFVFAPFDSDKGIVLIKADRIETTSFDSSKTSLKKKRKGIKIGEQEHLSLVQKGIAEINTGKLRKVVLSRKIVLSKTKASLEIFKSLLDTYSEAFCYLFHHPKVGTWCGATPETLMQIQGSKLKTMSLAATLPFEEGKEPVWGQKEVEEQQMVSDYIVRGLNPFSTEIKLENTKSVRAGNLWHLKTEISASLIPNASYLELIGALHPTPAVCGIPVASAKAFILENEGYDRSFYTGFLGEVNLRSQDEITLFVNLRCMELTDDLATIFVGGGITSSSNPKAEWMETQNKSQTMLSIL